MLGADADMSSIRASLIAGSLVKHSIGALLSYN